MDSDTTEPLTAAAYRAAPSSVQSAARGNRKPFSRCERIPSGLSRRRALTRHSAGRDPPERGLRSSVVQVESGRACRHSAAPTTEPVERGNPPRSLCHGHDRPGREAQSSRHQPIRYEGSGPHACRARHAAAQRDPPGCRRRATGAVKKTARSSRKPRIPTCGKTSCTTPACKRAKATQRATWLLQSKMRRSQWRGGGE